MNNVIDLPAADAWYHKNCSIRFFAGKDKPHYAKGEHEGGFPAKKGRKVEDDQILAFNVALSELLDVEDGQMKITDFIEIMTEHIADNCEPYSRRHTERLLENDPNGIRIDCGLITITGKFRNILQI